MRKMLLAALAAALVIAAPAHAACTPSWKLVGTDTFRYHDALLRSQGVTTDGSSSRATAAAEQAGTSAFAEVPVGDGDPLFSAITSAAMLSPMAASAAAPPSNQPIRGRNDLRVGLAGGSVGPAEAGSGPPCCCSDTVTLRRAPWQALIRDDSRTVVPVLSQASCQVSGRAGV